MPAVEAGEGLRCTCSMREDDDGFLVTWHRPGCPEIDRVIRGDVPGTFAGGWVVGPRPKRPPRRRRDRR